MKRKNILPYTAAYTDNEKGFALVTALLMLVILSLIGVAATDTAVLELAISGNERQSAANFYVADSTWQQSVPYLNKKPTAPDFVNLSIDSGSDKIVRNFGDGDDGETNDDFSENAKDGILPNMDNLIYWYKITYDKNTAATGSDPNFRDFHYHVENRTSKNGKVETTLRKTFKVGY